MSTNASPPWHRSEKTFVAGALAVALVMHLWNWKSLSQYPWFDFLGLDAKYYDEWALRILDKGLQGKDPYFMGPLYPHLLALVYAIFGRSLNAIRGLQIAMSLASIVLCHFLNRRIGGPSLARLSSAMAAVYAPIVYYAVSIHYPALNVFLACSILLLLLEAALRGSNRLAFASGIMMGVYALGRANILLFAPAAFLWLIAAWKKPFAPSLAHWREGVLPAVLLTLGTVLAVSPATIHNAFTSDPTFLTTNGGLNFYIGNGPMASGGHETPILYVERDDGSIETIVADLHKDVECRTEAERAAGRPLTYTETSSFWFHETFRYIREHPGTFLSKLVMKTVHFWSAYEIPQIDHFGYFRRFSTPLRGPVLTFGLVGPLSLLGMALALRQWRRWLLLYLFVFTYSTSIVLFFVLARYRLPIMPALFPFAAYAILEMIAAIRARAGLSFGKLAAATALLVLLAHANFYGVDEAKGIAQVLYRHGIVEDSRGNWEAAIRHYRDALAMKPQYDKCHLNLGVDLARVGRREEAMQHLLAAEELNPAYYRAPFNRGLLLEELGRYNEAETAYARAVELEPRYLVAVLALAEMRILRNDLDEARRLLQNVLDYDGRWEGEQNPSARARAAHLLRYLGEREQLRKRWLDGCFRQDESFRLAELVRLRGRRDEALERYRSIFAKDHECADAYRSLGELLVEKGDLEEAERCLTRALEIEPRFPGVHLALARLDAMRGMGEMAAGHLERELEVDPGKPIVHLELGLVRELLLGDSLRAEESYRRFHEAGGDPGLLEARRRKARAGGSS
jgi:tetratricopeptide (TPR) repeat protein